MTPFELVAALMTVVALAGWLNAKTLHVPNGVAMLIAGFAGAGLLFALQRLFPQFEGWKEVSDYINRIDFVSTVTGYMLAFLLFAGAMQVDLAEMRKRWMPVSALATFGVAASLGIVGTGLWLIAAAARLGAGVRSPDQSYRSRRGAGDGAAGQIVHEPSGHPAGRGALQ
jgi:monovalent cation:H+ antiporter, CPA1 family